MLISQNQHSLAMKKATGLSMFDRKLESLTSESTITEESLRTDELDEQREQYREAIVDETLEEHKIHPIFIKRLKVHLNNVFDFME